MVGSLLLHFHSVPCSRLQIRSSNHTFNFLNNRLKEICDCFNNAFLFSFGFVVTKPLGELFNTLICREKARYSVVGKLVYCLGSCLWPLSLSICIDISVNKRVKIICALVADIPITNSGLHVFVFLLIISKPKLSKLVNKRIILTATVSINDNFSEWRNKLTVSALSAVGVSFDIHSCFPCNLGKDIINRTVAVRNILVFTFNMPCGFCRWFFIFPLLLDISVITFSVRLSRTVNINRFVAEEFNGRIKSRVSHNEFIKRHIRLCNAQIIKHFCLRYIRAHTCAL